MADNYVDKLKIGGVDRPIQDTTSGFYAKPNTGIPSTDLSSDVQTSLGKADGAIPSTQKGANGGVASLGDDGKVPASQLPSYVDDVQEYDNRAAFPETGESGKIYVNKANNTTYRWSGTTYVQIKGDLVIGTTTGTAADGGTVNTHITDTDIHVTATDKTAWNGKYAKPSTGIPVSDLADGVIPTSLPANGGNAATVGGFTVGKDVPSDAVFTDNDTTYKLNINGIDQGGGSTSLGTVYAPTSAGTEGQMLIANASGIPTWGSKPSYAYSEIGYTVNPVSNSSATVSLTGTTPLHVVTTSVNITAVTLSVNPAEGHSCHVIFANSGSTDLTVQVTHDSTNRVCPGGADPDPLTIPAGGYVEVDFLAANSKVYVRGV